MTAGRPSIYTPELAAKERASIYALLDPVTLELRYIGKAKNPHTRLIQHLSDSKRKDAPVQRWIRAVGIPKMFVIFEDTDDWEADERRLIADAREHGFRLLNVLDGGNQPGPANSGKPRNGKKSSIARVSTPEKKRIYRLKRNLSSALARGELSDEIKAKMSLAAQKMPHAFGVWANV